MDLYVLWESLAIERPPSKKSQEMSINDFRNSEHWRFGGFHWPVTAGKVIGWDGNFGWINDQTTHRAANKVLCISTTVMLFYKERQYVGDFSPN
jgi:hypothetical protein